MNNRKVRRCSLSVNFLEHIYVYRLHDVIMQKLWMWWPDKISEICYTANFVDRHPRFSIIEKTWWLLMMHFARCINYHIAAKLTSTVENLLHVYRLQYKKLQCYCNVFVFTSMYFPSLASYLSFFLPTRGYFLQLYNYFSISFKIHFSPESIFTRSRTTKDLDAACITLKTNWRAYNDSFIVVSDLCHFQDDWSWKWDGKQVLSQLSPTSHWSEILFCDGKVVRYG